MGLASHCFDCKKIVDLDRYAARLGLLEKGYGVNPPRVFSEQPLVDRTREIPRDPTRAAPELTLAIRAVPRTIGALQSLVASARLTFWGEAVARVLAFCADNPGLAPLEGVLDAAPRGVLNGGGSRRNPNAPDSPRPAHGVLAALDPSTMLWLTCRARAHRVSRDRLASAIIYAHARPVVSMIQAATREGE